MSAVGGPRLKSPRFHYRGYGWGADLQESPISARLATDLSGPMLHCTKQQRIKTGTLNSEITEFLSRHKGRLPYCGEAIDSTSKSVTLELPWRIVTCPLSQMRVAGSYQRSQTPS
jgi:hypothetical protein